MTGSLTDKAKKLKTRRHAGHPMALCTLNAVELDDARFRELAYRFVRCTDLAEQDRLKQELVRRVARRTGSRASRSA
jgi:hypothetical protein